MKLESSIESCSKCHLYIHYMTLRTYEMTPKADRLALVIQFYAIIPKLYYQSSMHTAILSRIIGQRGFKKNLYLNSRLQLRLPWERFSEQHPRTEQRRDRLLHRSRCGVVQSRQSRSTSLSRTLAGNHEASYKSKPNNEKC